jgi:hypothetical protein
MKKRKRTSRKVKTFPTFPVPAGALPGTFKVDSDDEMIPVHNAAGRDPLIEKAASIVLPVLRAKKVTAKMIHVMLEEILSARKEFQSKGTRPNFNEHLLSIPKGPSLDLPLATLQRREKARLKVLDDLAKQAQELRMGYGKDDPVPGVFDKIRAFRSRQKPLSPGEAKRLIRAGRHRSKRVLLPEFKKLMAKKTAGSTQADLDAVREDR